MTPRFVSHAQNLFNSAYRHARNHARRPSRLTLGVGAATVATVGGVFGGLAATGSPAVATAAPASAVHAQASNAGQGASPARSSAQAAPAGATAGHAPAPAVATHSAAHAGHRAARTSTPAAHQVAAVRSAKPAHRSAAAAAPTQPYTIYDSVTPSAIPTGHVVATYATGPYAVPASQVAGRKVLWIDTIGTDPHANVLDVEPSDATPAGAAAWVHAKLSANPGSNAILYTMQSEWPSVQAAVGSLPGWMQHHVRWWIADPTGVPHVLPGASATQWYWGSNYDITTATPSLSH